MLSLLENKFFDIPLFTFLYIKNKINDFKVGLNMADLIIEGKNEFLHNGYFS